MFLSLCLTISIREFLNLLSNYLTSGLIRNDSSFISTVNSLVGKYIDHFEALQLREALETLMEVGELSNKYILDSKVFEKQPESEIT